MSNPCNLIQTNPTSATFPFRSCNYSAVSTSGLNTVAGTTSVSTVSVSGGWNSAYNLTNGATQQFILLRSPTSVITPVAPPPDSPSTSRQAPR